MMTSSPISDICKMHHTHDDQEPMHYESWHVWATEMTKTHTQQRCPSCHLYKVWRPRVYASNDTAA